ncbi:MAG TPA: hypothetical protein VMT80_00750 [Candidatus Paceibacterota bacterium]|nr:hypothetical protein [Candidatus Paceibacterota bacterium]
MTAEIIRGAFGRSARSAAVSASTRTPPIASITFEELCDPGIRVKAYLGTLRDFLRAEGFSAPARNAIRTAAPPGVSPRAIEMYQERVLSVCDSIVTGNAEPAQSDITMLFCFVKALRAIVEHQSARASPDT